MADRLLTPSKITAWLDCAHYLTLKHRVEDGTLTLEGAPFGALAQLLVDKGRQHESDCLDEYRRRGLSVLEVPEWDRGESFSDWVDRVGQPFDGGNDVIYQMPFIHDGIRGIADFLIRVEDPETGRFGYEPVDAKLARTEAKPGHVLQLCFYADAIEAATGHAPENVHLWLGSGSIETLRAGDFAPYWRRLRGQLRALLDAERSSDDTSPEPCAHCDFCEFAGICDAEWRGEDSLVFVAGIRTADRTVLEEHGVATIADLADLQDPVDDMQPERLSRLIGQASLQVEARTAQNTSPPFQIIPPTQDPTWGRGFELLPEPDEGDVFLDFEGHPFWTAATGLFFLFGFIAQDDAGSWEFEKIWAHNRDEEAAATEALVRYFVERRAKYPGMHVYHYNHTERSALERLAEDHGVAEATLEVLVETGLFVDLLVVARNAMQVGTESYGLKYLENLTDYERGHEIDQGAGAVVEYESFMASQDPTSLEAIAAYNEDDVRATMALRDWLVEQRPDDTDWRQALLELYGDTPELDEQVAALLEYGPDTAEHLLGQTLGYWKREYRAYLGPKLAKLDLDTPTLLDDPDVIAGLTPHRLIERTGKNGRILTPAMRFEWPDQIVNDDFDGTVLFSTPDGPPSYLSISAFDRENGHIDLLWNQESQENELPPTAIALHDWVAPRPKPEALNELASTLLDPTMNGHPNPASVALLKRDLPAFVADHGPLDGTFTDSIDDMTTWVRHLDHSYVAIQGPPGTGKTYSGARMVHSLIKAGKRVGITAMSHNAIDNLLEEIVDYFQECGDSTELKAVRRGTKLDTGPLPGVTYAHSNGPAANAKYNLVAGTTWLFAGKDLKNSPVNVLVVDEAGQLALADALAASRSAESLVLLGDPLQLPQVSMAAHPGGGGRSVLQHILGDDTTMPSHRGVFLSETRRMHPNVCTFISEQIYEGRLTSHEDCKVQDTTSGTGLRWLPATHIDRSTECPEEADIVAEEIHRLVGQEWTDATGAKAHLEVDDFMVVAPYNDQVRAIRTRLDTDPATRGVQVGTVDKFQGREAPVVFFTMTTSSAADMPRGADFLFSRHRLNVAISRARCLAYLVCTEELLNARARSVDDMRLISTLCSFVEYSETE